MCIVVTVVGLVAVIAFVVIGVRLLGSVNQEREERYRRFMRCQGILDRLRLCTDDRERILLLDEYLELLPESNPARLLRESIKDRMEEKKS
jgi:hypothetical protein